MGEPGLPKAYFCDLLMPGMRAVFEVEDHGHVLGRVLGCTISTPFPADPFLWGSQPVTAPVPASVLSCALSPCLRFV